MQKTGESIKNNKYPGRGIVIGKSPSGKIVIAYFIMGRSDNSRNRVFELKDADLFTKPYDESKVEDPSLIIYRAIAKVGKRLVVTNGDQTDTIAEFLAKDCDKEDFRKAFEEALKTREYEPDEPNFTPRISGIVDFGQSEPKSLMSILKRAEDGTCERCTFDVTKEAGFGCLIHTYEENGSPLPTFRGEPRGVAIPDDIEEFTSDIWDGLDEDNRISLYTRYIDLNTDDFDDRMININGRGGGRA